MKTLLVIAMLVILASTQATITPKTQACVCSNLLNQLDCQALNGCQWTPSNSTNSTNTATTALIGTCANATTNTTTPIIAIPTFCGSITNGITCAGQIGCAFLNSTCQIFTGCSAYVKTTHSDCQLISTQCTTDGTQCALPAACNTYTTEAICVGSQGSTTKNCKWTPASGTATTGTCSDTTCADAPTTLATLAQCQAYISTCFSTGKGCAATLASCTTYLAMDGCSARIGFEGKCIDSTPASANCRAQVCTDSTQATASSCKTFLSSSTCVFNGKGCVASPLPACNTYLVSQSCESMIGSDGKCTTDKNSTTNCKLYTCADAPTSTISDSDCQKIASTCVTNGQGCVTSPLQQCSTYTGTTSTPCTSFKGINGICKASTTAQCTERTCLDDAAKTFTTDAQCDSYFKGCITKGVGCVTSRSSCENYSGTAEECGKLIGTSGNCTFGTDGRCQTKQCSAADTAFTTNAQCQNYSYLCYTNGLGCTTLTTCEAAQSVTTCSGNNSCSSVNNLCLGVSDCQNFIIQSQCNLNNQIYQPSGSAITYSRKCKWSSGACSNIACRDIATESGIALSDLKDDAMCKAKLDGCLFSGAASGGCVDVNDDCTMYTGTQTTCQNYKGSQGKDLCINTSANASTIAACIKKACSSAKTQSITAISQQSHCQTFQSTGCYFDGVDNCTDGDCATYFLGDNCNSIQTAKHISGKTQQCVKDTTQSNNQCKIKTCADATPNGATVFNADTLCNAWLSGCVTDGTKCVDPTSTQCSVYKGTQDQCDKFSYKPTNISQYCTKKTKFCSAFTTCASHFIPSQLSSANDKSLDCQLVLESTDSQNCVFDSSAGKCANPTSCDRYVTTFTGAQAQQYCYSLKIKSKSCWWSNGNACAIVANCTSFTITKSTQDKDAAVQCQQLSPNAGTTLCGFQASATQCSARSCSDFGIVATKAADCRNYLSTCGYSNLGFCYAIKTSCDNYTIDATIYDTSIKKTKFCSSLEANNICTYDQKTDKCIKAQNCQDIQFTSTSEPDEIEKYAICRNARNQLGNSCAFYVRNAIYCADAHPNCGQYTPGGSSSAEQQTKCQNMVNNDGYTCNFSRGFCVDYKSPMTITNCNEYDTYQSTYDDNLKYCSNLVASQSGPKCGYSLDTASRCKTFSCQDLTSTYCANYSSLCVYSGISCISVQARCDGYTIETAATDKTNYCKLLTGQTGYKKCVYNGATSTTACSDRTCADLNTSDSYKTCTDYLATCSFDGIKCVSSLDCTIITPTGTDSDKATFCNKLGDGKKCTFLRGGDKCVANNNNCVYEIGTLAFTQAQAACSLAQDQNGKKCGYSTGSKCEARSCVNAPTASSTQNCVDWSSGCELDSTSSCAARNCNDAPITLNTDALCGQYKGGCLTTLQGCIDSNQPCSQYKGDATQCQSFTGNQIKCNNKNTNPTSNDSCVDKTCADNTVALSNSDCETWYPSKCIWNGTKGCWDNNKNCAHFQGTVDSCKIYKASDGPCSGTTLGSTLAACYSNNICNNAPRSIRTDADCKTWHQNCVTNGFGCIPRISKCTDIVDSTICAASALNCSSTGKQCLTKPTLCSSFTTASDCNNLVLSGATSVSCGWDTSKTSSNCVNLTCELLPATLTTDGQCASQLTQGTCTTSGAGCVTKDFCANYKSQAICQNAKSKDNQGSCSWENSTCRPIKCEDKTGASDEVCNTYLSGCRTNGASCVTSTVLVCQSLSRTVCLKDGQGNPCYWFQNTCLLYLGCTSLTLASHNTCQLASPFCTTDGTKCVAIDKCANLTKPSCFIGTDGTCGWGQTFTQTAQKCQVFTNCSAFNGTNAPDCATWGTKCVSDGTKCIEQSTCATYLTQAACGNLGTDGRCYWVAGTGLAGTCRLTQCSDATATDVQSLTTYVGCNSFFINASTKCNTNGTGCVAFGTCSSNQVQEACQVGTDGDCYWGTANSSTSTNTTTPFCRLKTCSDLTLTTSSLCSVAISKVNCVSDGAKCIPKAACSSYSTKEACSGNGTDGLCTFTPANSTSPTIGTCQAFSQCSDANSDSIACNTNPSCNFMINGTSTTCSQHTCSSKAQVSICNPIPSFDLSTYLICVQSGTNCVAGNADSLTQALCFDKSVNTFTWNPSSSTCQACNQITINNNVNNTNNQTNTFGKLLCCLALTLIMI